MGERKRGVYCLLCTSKKKAFQHSLFFFARGEANRGFKASASSAVLPAHAAFALKYAALSFAAPAAIQL